VSARPTLVWRPGCASCRASKEFLTAHGVEFESVNPIEAAGAARWEQLGRPRIPSLVLNGRTTAIYHVSQIAALVGLATGASATALQLAWDLAAILEAWSAQLGEIGWELIKAPTPSRGRSVRNLTVNVHEPVHEMTVAWEGGVFTWDTDRDEARARGLTDAGSVRSYAESRTAGWITFLMDVGDALGRDERLVQAGGETLSFTALLDAQRFHAAFHYRQLRTFLEQRDAAPTTALDLAQLDGLHLPDVVF
jgi:glutaredoxin